MKSITVFTPTYNRAALLPRLYRSLQRQTCQDFIWMIIDDGSTDGTKELVELWNKDANRFSIEYYYKSNGGPHTAYNLAISHLTTPLSVGVDSDDWLPEYAIEHVLQFWDQNGSEHYAGIIGLDYTVEGKIIGDLLPDQKAINLIDLTNGKYHTKGGDRTYVVRTDLYRQVAPMQVFPGEKYFTTDYMLLQLSLHYDFLIMNEKLKYVEYQIGGLSDTILKQYINSPNSFAELRLFWLSLPDLPIRKGLRQCIHLSSSGFISHRLGSYIKRCHRKGMLLLMIPFGWLLTVYIRLKNKR